MLVTDAAQPLGQQLLLLHSVTVKFVQRHQRPNSSHYLYIPLESSPLLLHILFKDQVRPEVLQHQQHSLDSGQPG